MKDNKTLVKALSENLGNMLMKYLILVLLSKLQS